VIVLLVAAGLTLRVGYVFLLERGETAAGDAIYYHHQANALAQGQGAPRPPTPLPWAWRCEPPTCSSGYRAPAELLGGIGFAGAGLVATAPIG